MVLSVYLLLMTFIASADDAVQPPVAKIVPHSSTTLGETRIDNYFWLRDRSDPDTIKYLEAENEYTKARMKQTDALQSKLYSEILGRIQQTDLSVPTKRDDYFYYTRTEEGRQYAIYCRKHGPDGKEEILLDGNAMAEGHKYFRVGNFVASPNHKLLAYSVDYDGDEAYTIHVKNLATGELLADTIKNTYYSLEWGNDNATFFYTVLDAAKRPYKVYRHTLGVKRNTLVCHETDERFTVELEKTRSRAYILINIGSSLTSEVRYIKADHPKGRFATLLPRVQETEYDVTHHGDSWFIRTNEGAKTFKLVEAPVKDPSRPNWKEVMAPRPEATIEAVTAFKDDLVTEERDRDLIKIRIQNFSTGNTHYIEFTESVYGPDPRITGRARPMPTPHPRQARPLPGPAPRQAGASPGRCLARPVPQQARHEPGPPRTRRKNMRRLLGTMMLAAVAGAGPAIRARGGRRRDTAADRTGPAVRRPARRCSGLRSEQSARPALHHRLPSDRD